MAEVLKLSFTKTLFVFQVLLLGLFAGYVDYKDDVSLSKTHALYSRECIYLFILNEMIPFEHKASVNVS